LKVEVYTKCTSWLWPKPESVFASVLVFCVLGVLFGIINHKWAFFFSWQNILSFPQCDSIPHHWYTVSPMCLAIWKTIQSIIGMVWFDLWCYTTLCDKVCQSLATGRWFSTGTPVSSTNKTDRHDITELLLKMTLSTINHTIVRKKAWINCK
jgi:hypothetical protein